MRLGLVMVSVWLLVFRYGPPTRTENRLIIENLSSKVSWQVIRMFSRLD